MMSQRIKQYRLKWGFSQEQMAEKIHKSQSVYNRIENNQTTPDDTTLQLNANAFGISKEELISEDPIVFYNHASNNGTQNGLNL